MSALSDALNAANVHQWSAREIARRTNGRISHSAVADYLKGRQAARPREAVLEAFAEVFPTLTLPKLRELAGLPAGEREPYEPPDEAHRLDARQRRAVDEMIRLLAEKNEPVVAGAGVERTASDVLAAQRRAKREGMQRIIPEAATGTPHLDD